MAGGSPQHATLVANTPTTFTFNTNFAEVEVVNVDGADIIYGTDDGVTTPVIGAEGTFVLPAAITSLVLTPRDDGVAHTGGTVIMLVSPGTPKVSVGGV